MPVNKNKYVAIVYTLLIACIVSCSRDRNTVYAQFVDIPSVGWDENEYCEFPTADVDSGLFVSSEGKYDLILAVRHSEAYPYTDLFLSLTEYPECGLPSEVHLKLATPSGKWLGHGSYGIFTYTDTIVRNVSLPPMFQLKVSQAMNRPLLKGVLNVGLVINSSQNKSCQN